MEYNIDIQKFIISHDKDVLLRLSSDDLEVATKFRNNI